MAVPAEPGRPAIIDVGVGLEVGRRGIEQQHINFEVEKVRHGEEHLLLHFRGCVCLRQQVHAPIRLIFGHRVQAGDRNIVDRPVGGGQLRTRIQRTVGNQSEQHPFHVGGELARTQDVGQCGVDTELVP